MNPNFDVVSVAGRILYRKQQIESATALTPVAVLAPWGAVFYQNDQHMGVVTSLVGLPIVHGEPWGLVYPLDIPGVHA